MGLELGLSNEKGNIGWGVMEKEVLGFWGRCLCLTGLWRKLPNEEIHDVCCSPNIISVIKWRFGRVADLRQKRNANGILVEKPQGMSLIWRPRCRWEDNVKRVVKTETGTLGTLSGWLWAGKCVGLLWARWWTLLSSWGTGSCVEGFGFMHVTHTHARIHTHVYTYIYIYIYIWTDGWTDAPVGLSSSTQVCDLVLCQMLSTSKDGGIPYLANGLLDRFITHLNHWALVAYRAANHTN